MSDQLFTSCVWDALQHLAASSRAPVYTWASTRTCRVLFNNHKHVGQKFYLGCFKFSILDILKKLFLIINWHGILTSRTPRFVPRLCHIIIMIIKTSSTGPSGKTRLLVNCFTSNQPTIDCSLKPVYDVPVSRTVNGRSFHIQVSYGRQGTPCKYGRSAPWYFKL